MVRYSDVQAVQMRKLSGALDRRRVAPIALVMVVTLTVLGLAGLSRVRLLCAIGLCLTSIGWQLTRLKILERRSPVSDEVVFAGICGIVLVHGALTAVAGGVTGPIAPIVLPPIIGAVARFGRSMKSRIIVLEGITIYALCAALPETWTGLPIAGWADRLLSVLVLFVSLGATLANISSVTDAYRQAGELLERTREEILVDLSDRERSLETIGAKVAHELKNPLAAIKGLVQLLLSRAVDRDRERLDVVIGEVTRMESIVRDYLSFSRPLESIRPREVPLGNVCDDVLAVLEARAAHAGVLLVRSGNDPIVVADGRRLKEALLNVVSNALEATPSGGRVEVRVCSLPDGASVVVEDSGRGIPADVLMRVGTPYFTTREGGTGLGVVLARSVVAQHGGELLLSSEPGRGTTVTITLPREPTAILTPSPDLSTLAESS